MAKRPSFQFYPADWLQDAALRSVSVGARGLWMEMICLMHQGSDYGFLKVNHKPILASNLARMCGASIEETEGWLAELFDAGVYSVDGDGAIFSRRMIRDEEVREKRAAGGFKGGNPKLLAARDGSIKVAEKVNLQDNLAPTPSSSSSSSSSEEKTHVASDAGRPACPHQQIIDLYHEVLPALPAVKVWNDKRRQALQARWREEEKRQSLGYWRSFFEYVGESDFLCGRSGTFRADLEWLVKSSNFVKVIEGKYENRTAA